MAVDVSPMQQHSNPNPMKIRSLLNHQATPMPQYSRHYSKDRSQRTEHASHLRKSRKSRPMVQLNGCPSKRPYVQTTGLSLAIAGRKGVGNATTSAPSRPTRRIKYSLEESYFIWHQRVVLCKEWHSVLTNFNHQFPNRQRLGEDRYRYGGIQDKFYRFIKLERLPAYRDRTGFIMGNSLSNDKNFIKSCTEVWYLWME
ncbi:hypothetical protein N7489_011642 [Penicillium chrysogenum]|uniref:uncharacterized protein n=1 Tax=Penicillium chrysogenum TaxID=5076 RepID=UPI0024DF29EA|nr:uncharacterized protein N7489_011642 [Penicillium chrysogenum]KAJ5230934.1 hypothetical protein N7489_011642 [Penicillium chrysogenum]